MCHIILSFPLLALPIFFFFPMETALPAYLLILLITGFVYFKVIAAMRSKVRTGKEGLKNEEALVIEDIDPEGKVLVWSEIWRATANGKKIRKGEKVRISGTHGLTLVVEGSSARQQGGPEISTF